MTDTLTIQPAPGRRVRDPATGQPLGPDPVTVPATPYWVRRLEAADVVTAAPKPPKPRRANRAPRAAKGPVAQ